MSYNDSPIHSPSLSSNLSRSGPNKQYLTPCRQVGLRRKSLSSKADETSQSKRRCMTPDEVDTPKSRHRMPVRKSLLSTESTTVNTKLEVENYSSIRHNTPIDATNRLNISLSIDTKENETENSHSSLELDFLTSESKAVTYLEDVKKRVNSKEKLKNSLELQLKKLKKGNEQLSRLENLRTTWKDACQAALKDLLVKTNSQGNSLTMKQLMEKLGISNELLPYNSDEEEFDDLYS